MLDEVLVAGIAAFGSDSSAVLCAEFGKRGALDIAEVRYGDDHLVVGIEIFGIEVACLVVYVGAALIAVFFAYLDEFVFDELAAYRVIVENEFQTLDLFHQFLVAGA